MDFKSIIKVAALLPALLLPQVGQASSGAVAPPAYSWSFQGAFGHFDQAALKRGAQVAIEVCMACHSIKYIKFDHLKEFGYTEAEVKALAESQGKTKKDKMISGMDPDAAKESFGVIPPDLSLITKARKGYEDYVLGLLNGYVSDDEATLVQKVTSGKPSETDIKEVASHLHLDIHHPEKVMEIAERINKGENFNKYFPGHFLAMPKPLSAGQVQYADGTENSLPQMAQDVVTFLAWAAEPTQMERKAVGFKVIIYLVILTIMMYAAKRRIWARIPH